MPHSRRSRSKCAADDNAPRRRSQQDSGEASAKRRTLPSVDVPDEENGDRKRTSVEFGGGEIGKSSLVVAEEVTRIQSSALMHAGGPENAGPSSLLGVDSNGNGQIDGVERRNLDSDFSTDGTISSRIFGEPQVASSTSAEPDDDKYSGGPSPTSSASLSSHSSTISARFRQSERLPAQAPPTLVTVESAMPGPTGPGPPPLLSSTGSTLGSAPISMRVCRPFRQQSLVSSRTVRMTQCGIDDCRTRRDCQPNGVPRCDSRQEQRFCTSRS